MLSRIIKEALISVPVALVCVWGYGYYTGGYGWTLIEWSHLSLLALAISTFISIYSKIYEECKMARQQAKELRKKIQDLEIDKRF